MSPPLRFLGLALGGWICLRGAMLVPDWSGGRAAPADLPVREAKVEIVSAAPDPMARKLPPPARHLLHPVLPKTLAAPPRLGLASVAAEAAPATAFPVKAPPQVMAAQVEAGPAALPPALAPAAAGIGRWSGSAWAFARSGGAPQLAPAGTLGGSQIGMRAAYRLNGDAARPLSLQVRAYSPAGDPGAAEAALGLEWQPVAGLPVRLVGERRQPLGDRGRSAFAVMAHGGVSDARAGPLTVEAYAQAGMVGTKSRDLFAEGSVAAGISLGSVSIGGGVWAGAQPGVSRLDAGPRLSIRLPGAARNLRVTADWRVRLAGDAAPGSGPALTIAGDF